MCTKFHESRSNEICLFSINLKVAEKSSGKKMGSLNKFAPCDNGICEQSLMTLGQTIMRYACSKFAPWPLGIIVYQCAKLHSF